MTNFSISPLTVANVDTYESDSKQNNTAVAKEQWSSASLPLCGEHPCLSPWFFFSLSLSLYSQCSLIMSRLIAVLCVSEELCLELTRAIEAGDTQAASQHASALARQKAALTIQLSEKNYADGEIR